MYSVPTQLRWCIRLWVRLIHANAKLMCHNRVLLMQMWPITYSEISVCVCVRRASNCCADKWQSCLTTCSTFTYHTIILFRLQLFRNHRRHIDINNNFRCKLINIYMSFCVFRVCNKIGGRHSANEKQKLYVCVTGVWNITHTHTLNTETIHNNDLIVFEVSKHACGYK